MNHRFCRNNYFFLPLFNVLFTNLEPLKVKLNIISHIMEMNFLFPPHKTDILPNEQFTKLASFCSICF